jgi:hypothetical protein
MIVYSYFHQGGGVPQNGTERDLRVLRNTVFPAGSAATSLTNFVSTLK